MDLSDSIQVYKNIKHKRCDIKLQCAYTKHCVIINCIGSFFCDFFTFIWCSILKYCQ